MNLYLLLFLILFPAAAAILMLFISSGYVRRAVVIVASAVICLFVLYLLVINFNLPPDYQLWQIEVINKATVFLGILIALFFIIISIREKKYIVTILTIVQAIPVIYFEFFLRENIKVEHTLFIDKFSIIMAFIIGIIGGLICVYALGYMRDFHRHHTEVKDRRRLFFFVIFLFLSAMFGIVFSNNLLWIYFFWEITTLSSFLLIRYTETKEAVDSSYNALIMNLLGGAAFAGAIFYLYFKAGTIELSTMLKLGREIVLIPAVLISFAGLTKSAQMPFSSWLLGAMVAPTPASALLHSSTMVKAGVYFIIKMSPILSGTTAGLVITFIGCVTFLFASLIAISQSNAKRVLAYSTIANLGLIVACGGIGSDEAVWAAILLIIFHAVAKGLLFITVGTIENKIGSRDIEKMDGLLVRMPRVGVIMVIGIAGMFLAPFGMLISKWAVLKAFIDSNPILAVILAYGSAATLFFWSKWLGKILAGMNIKRQGEETISREEWIAMYSLACLTLLICAIFPIVSSTLIEPYLISIFGRAIRMDEGNINIMLIMLGLIALLPLRLFYYRNRKDIRQTEPYMSGANVADNRRYYGSMGIAREIEIKNYYIEKYFGEDKLFRPSVVITIVLLVILAGVLIPWRG